MITVLLVAGVVTVIAWISGRERGREDTMREMLALPPPSWPPPRGWHEENDRRTMERIWSDVRGGELQHWNRPKDEPR
jgi:hypothetical protein